MEAASRWLCSFVAEKVRIQSLYTTTIKCGENVLLCSITLTDSKSKFNGYHENKSSVLYRDVEVPDCKIYINEVNSRQLDVYFYACRAGKATVRLDLGKWYLFEEKDQDIKVDVVPSSPKYLTNVEVSCSQKLMDEEHRPKFGTLYYDTKSLVIFNVVDEFCNIVEQIKDEKYYAVALEPHVFFNPLWWEIKGGEIFVVFCPKLIGENQLVVRLIDKRLYSQKKSTCTYRMSVKIFYPPCSPTLTLKFLDDHLDHRCTAGKEFILDFQLYDVFGKPVVKDSKEECNILVEAPHPKTMMKQHRKEHDEVIITKKVNEFENISFAVSANFMVAGPREIKLIAKSGLNSRSKYIYVDVLPACPDHLKDVGFTTQGAINQNFAADPAVMYREQWSVLEASIVDYYENIVQGQNQNYNVSFNLSNDKREKMKMTHKDVEIRNGKLQVKVMISEAGKHNLVITLTSTNNPDQVFRLKEIQILVNDAPFYLAGSELHFPDTCVAGKEFQLEIVPFDVFGLPVPVNSTTNCNLRGAISSLEVSGSKETIDFKVVKNEWNMLIYFCIVLTKAGSRKIMIFDKDSKSKKLKRYVNVNIVPSSPKYLISVEVSCCQKPVDEEYKPEIGKLYYGAKSLLTCEVADEFGNIIEQIENEKYYDLTVDTRDGLLNSLEWRMQDGKIFAIFYPKMIGENQIVIRLIDKRLSSQEESTCAFQMCIDILCPPCSPTLTLEFFDDHHGQRCTAGKEFILDVQLYDVFGKPVVKDSKEKCNIVVETPHPKTAMNRDGKEHDEMVNTRKINESENIHFAVSAHFKVAGSREVKLIAKSSLKSRSKYIYVEVLSSSPDHLKDVEFITQGAIDKNFAADPAVIYREQWSVLEAGIVDYYENFVQGQNQDYNVSFNLYSNKGENLEMTHKDVEIRNGKLRVKMMISEAGIHNLVITLTNTNNPDQAFRLKEIQIQVNDAPFHLAGSELHFPDTCVAGKEFQLKIVPFDVFGLPVPVNSTTDCNLRGAISSLEVSGSKETIDFKIVKNESNMLIYFCIVLTKAGSRKIMIFDKDNKSKKLKRHVNVNIVPSSPKCLIDVEVSCCQKPVDEEYKPETGKLYYGTKSLLTCEVADEFGNIIEQIENEKYYDLTVDPRDCLFNSLEWRIQGGKIFAIFYPKMIGQNQIVIRLIDKRLNSQEESTCAFRMCIDILCPPCSPTLTLEFFDDHHDQLCTAGKKFILDVQLYDVFGKPVVKDSKEKCNIVVEAPHPKTAMNRHGKEHDEMVNTRKINESENICFAVSAHFKQAGPREIKLIAKSALNSRSKYIYVEVLPSSPDHLKDVGFTTHGAIDQNFAADPSVMYREQWSVLEANIVDYYENIVQGQNQDYNVSFNLSSDKRKKMEMTHKDVEIRNGKLRVKVKISEAGIHNLVITLTSTSNPDQVFRLKEIQIQVNDAPFYLSGSELHFPDTCVAGKEFQLEIVPFDVFGLPVPVNSTSDCNLRGVISSVEVCGSRETIDFKIVKNETSILIRFSIVLTKAGRRKLTIFDMNDKSKELWVLVNPDVSDVHWEPTASEETVYRRENLILTMNLFDCCNNEVRICSSESIPGLRQQAGPAGGLHCTEKSTQSNTVTIQCDFKKTGKYDLCLADRDGDSLEGTLLSVIVQDAPLDNHRSSVTWLPQYDEMQDQPVFPEDESFQCCLTLKDVVGCNYDGGNLNDCIKVKCGKAEVKDITVSSSANEIGSYNIVVPLKKLVRNDPNPKFWCFVNDVKIEEPLLLPTFEGFQEYDDDDCFVVLAERSIVCRHVTEEDITGEDFSQLNNIKRICELYDDPEFVEGNEDEIIGTQFGNYDRDDYDEHIGTESDKSHSDDRGDGDDVYDDDSDSDYEVSEDNEDEFICTIIKLPLDEIENKIERNRKIRCTPAEIKCKLQKFRSILLHLLRANYYREEAFQIDKDREEWKNRARESYEKSKAGGNKDLPRFCSQIKEKYARLMRRYHDAACEEFFKFFNTGRCQSEIDLHGLLVVDEKKLQDYKRQLQGKGRLTNVEVERKIAEERDHGNEAVRKLRERLDKYDMERAKQDKEPWLEIIVGSGHHSKVRQQIRPKVEDFLKKEKRLKFSPVNKGALVVTFKKYAGRQPCYGEYYCPKCHNRWRNGRSWIDKWQACYDCYEEDGSLEKCYPLKQRSRRKTQTYNPKVVSTSWKPSHVEELCQKCIELGELCPSSQL